MDILKALRFVRGAVSTKDLVPELQHFAIEDGTVRGYNGMLAIGAPIPLDLACNPRAAMLVAAIGQCEEVASLSLTPAGKLRVQSGKFRALVECTENHDMHLQPEGELVQVDGALLLRAIQTLLPFVGSDATRPWSSGVLLRGQSAFATNNVCLAEFWLGIDLPFVANIPVKALAEVVRVGEPPTHVQLATGSITFHYSEGRWIRTQLFDTEWPPLESILNRESAQQPVPEGLFAGLAALKAFLAKENLVYFRDGHLHTAQEDAAGASYAVPGLPEQGLYHAKMLGLLEGVATTIDLAAYPAPCLFYGDGIRGAILGRRA